MLPVSPGRPGFTPELSLSYDSGSGNGPFGLGWSLNLLAIRRRLDRRVPGYGTDDVFMLTGQDGLVPVLEPDGAAGVRHGTADRGEFDVDRYRPRVEGMFGRIERWVRRTSGDIHWRTISRDNVATVLGRTPDSRIADPADPGRVVSWLASAGSRSFVPSASAQLGRRSGLAALCRESAPRAPACGGGATVEGRMLPSSALHLPPTLSARAHGFRAVPVLER